MPGEGPTWISGLTVLPDKAGRERMFAFYAKIRKQMEVYERGMVEFNPQSKRFDRVTQFPEASKYSGEHPDGHAFLQQDRGIDYVYYANPYPLIRVRADFDLLKQPDACEAYTCLVPGTRLSDQQLDRGPDRRLRYGWKVSTQLLRHDQQAKLIAARRMSVDESLLNLRDIDSGKTVVAHGGTVYWNAYRNRWVMITVESFGSTSLLGEIWYAEGDTPLGPWVYARKVVTHDKYSFYNPKQHPMFDKEGGRIIFFEGTYTTTFSGNQDPTPRYDYNQVMYQLDLADPRLALPVAIYLTPASAGAAARLEAKAPANGPGALGVRRVAFFAPDREGIATLPVFEENDPRTGQRLRVGASGQPSDPGGPRPLFYILPADVKDYTLSTAPLYEQTAGENAVRLYTVEPRGPQGGGRLTSKVLGRVWKNPGSLLVW